MAVRKVTELEYAVGFDHEQLVNHIKSIGQAIIDDAETISLNPALLKTIEIRAIIDAGELTKIEYSLEKNVKPTNLVGL